MYHFYDQWDYHSDPHHRLSPDNAPVCKHRRKYKGKNNFSRKLNAAGKYRNHAVSKSLHGISQNHDHTAHDNKGHIYFQIHASPVDYLRIRGTCHKPDQRTFHRMTDNKNCHAPDCRNQQRCPYSLTNPVKTLCTVILSAVSRHSRAKHAHRKGHDLKYFSRRGMCHDHCRTKGVDGRLQHDRSDAYQTGH